MIICEQVKKSYMSQQVFDKFAYKFNNTGFYLLFGESGSGKTTLLNILSGHIPYDSGVIKINGMEYSNQVKVEDVDCLIDYITQDANFIDYLSVYDNLALCTTNEEMINEYLNKFQLIEKRDMLPTKLSGGEKQRLCLIRSLVRQKKILLLDEPTASLDRKNKKMVFDMLQELKNSVLIICSSHDEVAKEYADEYVDFSKLQSYESLLNIHEDENDSADKLFVIKNGRHRVKREVSSYVRKWFKSPYKEKRSSVKLCIIMILVLMALCMGDTPDNKFRTSIEYIYGLNQLTLWIDDDKLDYVETLYERDDIEEIVLQYENSVPYDENGVMANAEYELAVWTLPANAESLHISDYLSYGRYIKNENEIILSDAMALKLGNPEKLIGQKMQIKLYGGTYDMTIVGIFDEFTDIQKEYMANSRVNVYDDKESYNDRYAISAAFTNKFINDEKFVSPLDGGQRCYILYFKSYSDMMEFYEEYEKQKVQGYMFTPPYVDLSTEHVFSIMHEYIVPIAVLVMFLAVLFYFQTQKTELMYNMKLFAVYQYLGYSIRRVKLAWIMYSIFEILKVYIVSGIISIIITIIVNQINRQEKFIPFEIFTYNVEYITYLFLAVIVVSVLNAISMLRGIKTRNINKNLIEQRDIL